MVVWTTILLLLQHHKTSYAPHSLQVRRARARPHAARPIDDDDVAAGVGPRLPLENQGDVTAEENQPTSHGDLMSPTVDEAALLTYRDPTPEEERDSRDETREQNESVHGDSLRTVVSDHNYAANTDGADSQTDVASQARG